MRASLAVILVVNAVKASQVRLVNLEELANRAQRIFSGVCLASETERDPGTGIAVTVATFEVQRSKFGTPSSDL